MIEDILKFNEEFVAKEGYKPYITSKYPDKKIAIVTCMETINLVKRCGIDLDKWFEGFCETEQSVKDSVELVRNHPFIPDDVNVSGYIMDSTTGKLTPLNL